MCARRPIEGPPMESPCTEDRAQANTETIYTLAGRSSSAVWGNVIRPVTVFLMVAGVIQQARGGNAKQTVLQLNAMFDSVWCPLPTWVHIVLVFAAWALFVRVAKDFAKGWRRDG